MLYQTNRLRARQLSVADYAAMFEVYSDAAAMRWVGDGKPITEIECQQWIQTTLHNYATRGYGMAVLEKIDDGEVVGFCGIVHPKQQLEPEIKYALKRKFWGAGLATEAVIGMLRYGLDAHQLQNIIATVDPDNLASARVLEKAGLAYDHTSIDEAGLPVACYRWVISEAKS
jgi:[ribosomal protein S5]-alanine N-acetyltransferase